ncbi:MAG: hypothetical protein P8N00_06585 [Flavobacteriales bacterium]|nr:hypothetical protein [Flavobacteriales bacterium]
MKLLIIPSIPYPIRSGGDLEVYFKIKALENESNLVIICPLSTIKNPEIFRSVLKETTQIVFYKPLGRRIKNIFSLMPYGILSNCPADKAELFNHPRLQQKFEVIIIDHIFSSWACLAFKGEYIFRSHNVEYRYVLETQSKIRKKLPMAMKYLLWELIVISFADRILPISSKEIQFYSRYSNKVAWAPAFRSDKLCAVSLKKIDRKIFLFYANYFGGFNVKETMNMLMEISAIDTSIKIVIAGRNSEIFSNFNIENKVRIWGTVEDEENLMEMGAIRILLANGESGVKMKLIDSIVSGIPFLAQEKVWVGSGMSSSHFKFRDTKELIKKASSLDLSKISTIQNEFKLIYNNGTEVFEPNKE